MNQWSEGSPETAHAVAAIKRQRYGMIRVVEGRVAELKFRWWPRWGSWLEIVWWESWRRRAGQRDECRLYYAQPRAHSNYLTLNYIASNAGTSLATFRRALTALDQIALIKRSDALLCQVSSRRISDRLLVRWGWQQHLLHSRQRHWIKRFYGQYENLDTDFSDLVAHVARLPQPNTVPAG